MSPTFEVFPLLTGTDNRLRFAWALHDPDREAVLRSATAFSARSDARADALRWQRIAAAATIVDRDRRQPAPAETAGA